ncbi:uncharacterized protein MEPE_04674 [Melanopsichium pennsylvanicum]|uniref:Uncharacterized protein n=1 Tax=Melanopsichium pennsylvanicum TaxID=63383 RepID=A0AAJ5C6L1_9BASI|nr:uncharacterized protein MEPE_04674 [Melanopsichium pennsylvanicum]
MASSTAARPSSSLASASGTSNTTAGFSNTAAPSSSSSSSSSSSTTVPSSTSSTSTQAQTPQISLLGTLPHTQVPSLLRRIESALVHLPPTLLCEKETVLARYDDTTSGIRETGDNAWASVVKARRGVKLRVLETLQTRTGIEENGGSGDGESSVECTLHLPLPSLPERQYPRASVRPSYFVQMLSDTLTPFRHQQIQNSQDPFRKGYDTVLGLDPSIQLNTDRYNGWKSLVSTLGWRPHFIFFKYGLSYTLNTHISRSSTTTSTNPLNPSQTTKYTLNVYRIFTKDPTAWSDDWVPLDPLASTTVVEMVGVVGGMVDQAHFNAYCSTGDAAAATRAGLDPESTIENAIEFADTVAKALRGLVDLRREAYD